MTTLADAMTDVAVSALPAQTLTLAHRHIQGFLSGSGQQSEDARDWDNVAIAPLARHLYDPAYQHGAVPAYAELRIVGAGDPQQACGYLIVSLTEDDFPVAEFATRGATKTDRLVQSAAGGTIHKFMRYSPGYVVGEDADGKPIATLGSPPLKATGSLAPDHALRVVSLTNENGPAKLPQQLAMHMAPAASYDDLRSHIQSSPVRIQLRAQRSRRAAAAWRLANGARNPTLRLQVGEIQDFLLDRRLAGAGVEALEPIEVVRVAGLPSGGLRVEGLSAGSVIVRVEDQAGAIDYYTIAVAAKQLTLGGAETTTTSYWRAGSGWDGDQRQYDQLRRERWCPNVGCGPTALAMLFGWWDANGVPSIFYRLDGGVGDAKHFRFNYESLRDSDAPKSTANHEQNEALIVPLYDDLYSLCNVMCPPFSDQGATMPDQLASAFEEYSNRVAARQPSPIDKYGEQFVGYSWRCHYSLPGLSTDWEGGGKHVAAGIQAGRPGIVGIGATAFEGHYPLAYGYKIVRHYEGSELAEVDHFFKCNMGWGPYHSPEYHNAENVWFGLTARFWQKKMPTPPNDIIAATLSAPGRVDVYTRNPRRMIMRTASSIVGGADWPAPWAEIPSGVFLSGPAACASADGRSLHAFGRGLDNAIWQARSPDGGASWDLAWAPIPEGVFTSGPAACTSADGRQVHVFGRGNDNRIWRAYSPDGGANWSYAWGPIGDGVFTSDPAACISADGRQVHVFGRGNDNRIWRAYSSDGGANWSYAWGPIGDGVFKSGPAACISADGRQVHVFGRGNDDRIWRAYSPDGGASWTYAWGPIGEGVFISSPAAATSPDGRAVHVFGIGTDRRIWRAYSLDGGSTWPLAWAPIDGGLAY